MVLTAVFPLAMGMWAMLTVLTNPSKPGGDAADAHSLGEVAASMQHDVEQATTALQGGFGKVEQQLADLSRAHDTRFADLHKDLAGIVWELSKLRADMARWQVRTGRSLRPLPCPCIICAWAGTPRIITPRFALSHGVGRRRSRSSVRAGRAAALRRHRNLQRQPGRRRSLIQNGYQRLFRTCRARPSARRTRAARRRRRRQLVRGRGGIARPCGQPCVSRRRRQLMPASTTRRDGCSVLRGMGESGGWPRPPSAMRGSRNRQPLPNAAAGATISNRSEWRGEELVDCEGSERWSDVARGSGANRVHALK